MAGSPCLRERGLPIGQTRAAHHGLDTRLSPEFRRYAPEEQQVSPRRRKKCAARRACHLPHHHTVGCVFFILCFLRPVLLHLSPSEPILLSSPEKLFPGGAALLLRTGDGGNLSLPYAEPPSGDSAFRSPFAHWGALSHSDAPPGKGHRLRGPFGTSAPRVWRPGQENWSDVMCRGAGSSSGVGGAAAGSLAVFKVRLCLCSCEPSAFAAPPWRRRLPGPHF